MLNFVWLSRVVLLGLTGTATILTFWFSTLSQTPSPQNSEQPSQQPIALSPEALSAGPLPVAPPQSSSQASDRVNPQAKAADAPEAAAPSFSIQQSLTYYAPLFSDKLALGMLAIGAAEGNYRIFTKSGTLYVQQTPFYFGHTDPGNLSWGQVVTNYGPCSDQGRSDGNITLAEQYCLERSREALPTHLQDLSAAGINPNQDLEAVLNAADLYNQAQPIHSRRFPQALRIARQGGLSGVEAIAWARTASFYLNARNELDLTTGSNQASGLLGICSRRGRPITEWQCVYEDQMRRVEAISDVVNQYLMLAQQTQKSQPSEQG